MSDIDQSTWSELSRLGLASNAPDGDWRLDMDRIRQLSRTPDYEAAARALFAMHITKDLDDDGVEAMALAAVDAALGENT